MAVFSNPALDAFVGLIHQELTFAQVQIRPDQAGFELRHVDDRGLPVEHLRNVNVEQLRDLAQFTAAGAFRPLKSAPTLRRGWISRPANAVELGMALDHLYPGGVGDWFAATSGRPPVTDFREFTQRQTGMYRVTTKLSDAQAARVIRAGCHATVCLKRRQWTVPGLAPDLAAEKSLLQCLEPCPLLLEFARKAMRLEQDEMASLTLPAEETKVLLASLRNAFLQSEGLVREADFDEPLNPRRIRLVLERALDQLSNTSAGP